MCSGGIRNYKETLGTKETTLRNVWQGISPAWSTGRWSPTDLSDNAVRCAAAGSSVPWFSGNEILGSWRHPASLGRPQERRDGSLESAMDGLGWDSGKMHSVQGACLENHLPKPCAGPGALSGQRYPHVPAHCCPRPAHSPVSALNPPAALHFPAGSEGSGLRSLPRGRPGRGALPLRVRPPSGGPAPLPLRPDLVRPGRRLASSAAPASGGLFKSYLWRSGGGLRQGRWRWRRRRWGAPSSAWLAFPTNRWVRKGRASSPQATVLPRRESPDSASRIQPWPETKGRARRPHFWGSSGAWKSPHPSSGPRFLLEETDPNGEAMPEFRGAFPGAPAGCFLPPPGFGSQCEGHGGMGVPGFSRTPSKAKGGRFAYCSIWQKAQLLERCPHKT